MASKSERAKVTKKAAVRRGRAKLRLTRPAPPAAKARARRILDRLEAVHPEAECALHYRNAFELLVATILSAQCTDRRVNEVTPALFARYPDAAALAAADAGDVERLIQPTGFFRSKTKSLLGCARALTERHDGDVPRTMAEMVKLPGAGRKTASVVLGHAYGIAEGIAVDTHVLRVAARLGLTRSGDPQGVEQDLMALIPRRRWIRTTDLLIFHGRKICGARRPSCGECPLFDLCRWPSRQAHATPPPKSGTQGRPRRRQPS